MKKAIALFVLTIFTWGCTVGPNYHRPKIDVPSYVPRSFAAASGTTSAESVSARIAGSAPSFGDQKWWEVFQDPQLQELIRTALQQNYDVRIAATRILRSASAVRHHAG